MLIYNLQIFIRWWMFFSCYHYFISKISGNNKSFSPPLGLAIIVIVLYLSGICLNTLVPGFWLIISLSFLGLILMIYEKKWLYWKELFFPSFPLSFYYFLSFLFFCHSIYFSNGFSTVDDKHHWAIIMNGIGHYQNLIGFPRNTRYDNYTLGTAIWGYFINKLAFSKFRLDIANWSNVLISLACFMPSLSLFNFDKKNIPKYVPFLLSFFLFLYCCFTNFFIVLTLVIFVICCTILIKNKNAIEQIFLFSSWFLIFSFLLVSPSGGTIGYHGDFRSMPPDHVIFVTSFCAFSFYLIKYFNNNKQKFSYLFSAIYISLLLTLCYLFKTPGLFLAISVATTIVIHFTAVRFNLISQIIIKLKLRKATYLSLMFFCVISSIIVPPLLWNHYCVSHNRISPHPPNYIPYNYTSLKKCFFEKKDPIFSITRAKFFDKFYNFNLFQFSKNIKIFKSFNVDRKIKATYPVFIFTTFLFSLVAVIILRNNRKFKLSYLIFLSIFGFLFLHIAALLILYCIHFGITYERFTIPSFGRYASPMIKLLISIVTIILIIAIQNIRLKNRKLILTIICLLIAIFLQSLISLKLYKKIFPKPELKSLYRASCLPYDFNFQGKKLLTVGYFDEYSEFLSIFMLYPYSSPAHAKILEYPNYALIEYAINKYNYDFLWWQQDNTFESFCSLTNNVSPYLLNLVDDPSYFINSCLFKCEKNGAKIKLKPVFMDCLNTNIIKNSTFKDNLDYWECNNVDAIKILNENNNFGVSFHKKPLEDLSISQRISLSQGCFYRLISEVGGYDNNYVKLGDHLIHPEGTSYWKKIDYYFYSNNSTNELLKIVPDGQESTFLNIKLINLGAYDRNNNTQIKYFLGD